MNLDYWEEHIKVTIAVTAHLAVPVTETEEIYLPMFLGSMTVAGRFRSAE